MPCQPANELLACITSGAEDSSIQFVHRISRESAVIKRRAKIDSSGLGCKGLKKVSGEAKGRIGEWAYRRMGVSACRRIGGEPLWIMPKKAAIFVSARLW